MSKICNTFLSTFSQIGLNKSSIILNMYINNYLSLNFHPCNLITLHFWSKRHHTSLDKKREWNNINRLKCNLEIKFKI